MRVALVHDDLYQWGGAERTLLEISEIFPHAPIYTSVYNFQNKTLNNFFGQKKIVTSFLQNIPGWRLGYRAFLPLYPIAFEQFDFSSFDLVISQSTRFAKVVITKPRTNHICYCHTPSRFLWNFSRESTPKLLDPYLSFLRLYDQVGSKRVDSWIAGSVNARKRIKRVYQVDSRVCYPPVDLDFAKKYETFDGGYFLIISRLNPYKRVDIAINCFNKNGLPLKIIGTGPQMETLQTQAGKNIEFLGSVSEKLRGYLLAGCKALIISAEEDFGLTSLEAQSFGKGVVAFRKGGSLETVVENKTGIFFDNQDARSLEKALIKLASLKVNQKDCQGNARRFSRKNFKRNFLKTISEC